MNFILFLLIVAYFYLSGVNCRSVQIDSDTRSVLDGIADKDGNHDAESSGIFSWIRLKPFLRQEVQRVKTVKGETDKFNKDSTETTSLIPSKEDENMHSENEVLHTKENNSLKAESPKTDTSFVKLESVEHNLNKDPDTESNETEELISNTTQVMMHQMDHSLVADNFPDNVISNILNQSSDSIFLQALNDNSSNIDSIEFDETSLMSEGGHILATLQEVSTMGFELLIDSETKQNSILAELLNSQSNLIDDDLGDEDINFVTIQLNHGIESELQEAITNIEQTGNPDVEFSTDEVETKNSEFDSDEDKIENTEFGTDEDNIENNEFDSDEDKIQNTEFDSDEDKIESTEFNSNEDKIESTEFDSNENKIENTEFDSDENKIENTEFDSDGDRTEDPEFDAGEIEIVKSELEFSDSFEDEKITEISTSEPEDPKCPDPGWCIFWFMALDLCAKDSHCHGTLLCCTIGCSKTCVDPDDELL